MCILFLQTYLPETQCLVEVISLIPVRKKWWTRWFEVLTQNANVYVKQYVVLDIAVISTMPKAQSSSQMGDTYSILLTNIVCYSW